MRKYWFLFSNRIQTLMAYRLDFIGTYFFSILQVFTMILVFNVIYKSGQALTGYSFGSLVMYYVLVSVFSFFATSNRIRHYITIDIKNGLLSFWLLKPCRYNLLIIANFLAELVLGASIAAVVLVVALAFFPVITIDLSLQLLVVVMLSLVWELLFSVCVGLLSFWLSETEGLSYALNMLVMFAVGSWIPLDVLPKAIAQAGSWLPFQYQVYFPIQMLLGRTTPDAFSQAIVVQLVWIGTFALLARWMWFSGIKEYEAYGG